MTSILAIMKHSIIAITAYVTLRVKTSLVHTSNFATLEVYNFPWEEYTGGVTKNLKFTGLVKQTSLHHC